MMLGESRIIASAEAAMAQAQGYRKIGAALGSMGPMRSSMYLGGTAVGLGAYAYGVNKGFQSGTTRGKVAGLTGFNRYNWGIGAVGGAMTLGALHFRA